MKYPCIIFKQRIEADAPQFCLFNAPVSEVIEWSIVPRINPADYRSIQREKNDFKIRSIANFLNQDPRNTIPSALILTIAKGAFKLTSNAAGDLSFIELEVDQKENICVIDGQHRLLGVEQFDKNSKIPIVAILDASDEEKAFQFIVINNKVTKVPADHIRALALNFKNQDNNEDLENRLKSARLTLHKNVGFVGLSDELSDSPFRNMVALPGKVDRENRFVVPSAIEASIAFIQSKKFKQLIDDDSALEFFLTIWSYIKENWPHTFNSDSKLLAKVGLVSMTKFITEALDSLSTYSERIIDFGNSEDVVSGLKRIMSLQVPEFWLTEWTSPASDTKSFRDQIEISLKIIQQNIRDGENWANGVSLVRPSNPS